MPGSIRVLAHDVDLLAGVPTADRRRAVFASVAAMDGVPAGPWHLPDAGGHGAGLLVVSGLTICRLGRDGHHGAELLAPGDLLRPWEPEVADPLAVLPMQDDCQVVAPLQVAVLDESWLRRMAAWPAVVAALMDRLVARSRRLAAAMVIAQQRELDLRIELMLWKLAERFGVVGPAGVRVPLPITQEMLGNLVCAQRPSVSAAVGRLERSGRLRRDGCDWYLLADPPALTGPRARLAAVAPGH